MGLNNKSLALLKVLLGRGLGLMSLLDLLQERVSRIEWLVILTLGIWKLMDGNKCLAVGVEIQRH